MEPHQWPEGTYGGTIQLLLGVGSLNFRVIFNYHGLVFVMHHLDSDKKVCFGGSYRPKNKSSSTKDFNTPMMAMIEDTGPATEQDSILPMIHDDEILTNHPSIQNFSLTGCRTITSGYQQINISGCTYLNTVCTYFCLSDHTLIFTNKMSYSA